MSHYYYSPHTGEHIVTDDPQPWMGSTNIAPPAYEPSAASAIFDGTGWRLAFSISQVQAPETITMRQCRLHLLATGKLSLVQTAIDSLPEPMRTEANIEWEYGAVVQRSSPLIAQLAPVLGWNTPEQIDEQFVEAAKL